LRLCAHAHQPGQPQRFQVLRNGGRRDIEMGADLAGRAFAWGQHGDNGAAGWVRKCLKNIHRHIV
jgi:hypothetical protein